MRLGAFGYTSESRRPRSVSTKIKLRNVVVELRLPFSAATALGTCACSFASSASWFGGLKMGIGSGSETVFALAVPTALKARIAGDEHYVLPADTIALLVKTRTI